MEAYRYFEPFVQLGKPVAVHHNSKYGGHNDVTACVIETSLTWCDGIGFGALVLQTIDDITTCIRDGPFDQEEYEKARKSLVEEKACGEDGIPPEVLKRCKGLDTIILDFCNRALIEGEKPEQWSLLNIIPIPKSGDLRLGSNYRGISLSSLVPKTFNRMLLNRIRPAVDEHLRYNQHGFREGRSTVGHILALRRLIEGVKSHSLPAIITFIDFKKAFDTIHQGKMLKILQAYVIPERIVSAIGRLYENTRAKVTTPDGDTKPFKI
ncbi:Hypp3435 [Branchiostoma lanceolatum]|uniref:Hypp3435 protein n=1 Tax=Branchiostoma lanceolatum TaxID=7740 RepID=A0A8K0A211_BRALA|nr:Hypp3435 [Branchiostoma lanceolatum]